MKFLNKRKSIYIGGVIIVLIFIISSLYICGNKDSNIIVDMFNNIYLKYIENDEYKNGFEKTTYKNYTILYNEKLQSSLLVVQAYLDSLEEKSNDILGWIPTDNLTIQFDYDKKIFEKRYNKNIENVVGYYHRASNTIYIYVDDSYREILLNMPRVEDGVNGLEMASFGFKETLFHEYAHYMYNSFLKENNIDLELIPMWFEEGITEYIAESYEFNDEPLDFIPFEKLNSSSNWVDSVKSNTNTSPYTQSHYAVYKIINQNNENILREIILKSKKMEFEKAFEQVMKISLDEFENYIKSEYNNYSKMYSEIMNLNNSKYDEVKIKGLEEYIKANENDVRAYDTLTNFYKKYGYFDKAEALLKDGINKNPKESILWRRLAIFYEDNNMLDLAQECFKKEDSLIEH